MKPDKQAIPLKLTNFSKRYGDVSAISEISLEVNRGEVFGFLGPNGAGKTTTIRTILNFMEPSSGTIEIFGLDSVKNSVEAKNYVGYLAGDIALYDKMTGQQIIDYLSSLGKNSSTSFIKKMTGRFKADLTRPMKTLSKGNKQKIGLIQAFMHKPDLVLLDEPTSGLDPLIQEEFYKLVHELREEGKTIFVSSHNLTEIQKICDRAAFIRNGELISVEDIQKADNISIRKFSVWFNDKTTVSEFKKLKSVQEVTFGGNQGKFVVKGPLKEFLKALSKHDVVDIDQEETPLEEIFMDYYKGQKNA